MRRGLLWCLLLLFASSCSGRGSGSPEPATVRIAQPGLGISFELPESFESSEENGATVYAGKTGEAAFTTITLQASDPRKACAKGELEAFARVLDLSYTGAQQLEAVQWAARTPQLVGDAPALRYTVRFTLHERARLRTGLLLCSQNRIVDINYTTPVESFADNVAVFEHLVATLRIDEPDGTVR